MGKPCAAADVYLSPQDLPRLLRLGDRLLPEITLRDWMIASAAVQLAQHAVSQDAAKQLYLAELLAGWADNVLRVMEAGRR